MINLHESMGPDRDRTRDPWICSQTRTCSQTRYRLTALRGPALARSCGLFYIHIFFKCVQIKKSLFELNFSWCQMKLFEIRNDVRPKENRNITTNSQFLNVLINSTSMEEHMGPVHKISVLIAYAQKLLTLNAPIATKVV